MRFVDDGDLDRLTDDALKFAADSLGRYTRKNTTVHGGARLLRQRVLGVPRAQHGGDTGRARGADMNRVFPKLVSRRGILRVGAERAHGSTERTVCDLTRRFEKSQRGIGPLNGEAIALDFADRGGEFVDRVVFARL